MWTLIFIGRGASGVDMSTTATTITAIICLIALVGITVFFFLSGNFKTDKHWDKGLIPKSFKPTKTNVFEIYIAAATAIIARDPSRMSGKFGVLSRLLRTKFPNEYYEFGESYKYSLQYIVRLDSLVEWCNNNVNENRKTDLFEFMATIALSDGVLTSEERIYLLKLLTELKLRESLIQKELWQKILHQERTQSSSGYSSESTEEKHLALFGLSKDAPLEEIKSAYRSLAKLTHPDRFANQSEEVQQEAKKRFQEIQNAYDFLVKK